ncbi:MAG: peptidoglycan-binding domain-containing protein [Acidimicrobiales bacterium]
MNASTRALKSGDTGDDVVELHARLTLAGYLVETFHHDRFEEGTTNAVKAFQRGRGIDQTGTVDHETWVSLAEAGHHFGERLLCRRTPMMRGDDVGELQLMLGSLGFDAGWIDGIFGPDTEIAVADFQRNAGLPVDGVAGPTTCATLTRLRLSANAARPVAAVRERERLRTGPRGLVGRRIVVGDLHTSPTLAAEIGSVLRNEGARVLLLNHPDGSTHARAANQFDAELYLGVYVSDEPMCTARFYETDSFSSYGGSHLASIAIRSLGVLLDRKAETEGSRTPVLRETRMPAVVFRLGPPEMVSSAGVEIAEAILGATTVWVTDPEM